MQAGLLAVGKVLAISFFHFFHFFQFHRKLNGHVMHASHSITFFPKRTTLSGVIIYLV